MLFIVKEIGRSKDGRVMYQLLQDGVEKERDDIVALTAIVRSRMVDGDTYKEQYLPDVNESGLFSHAEMVDMWSRCDEENQM